MYPHFQACAPWHPDNASLSVFDLSRFLRQFPIRRQSGPLSPAEVLELLRNPRARFSVSREQGMPESIERKLTHAGVIGTPELPASVREEAEAFASEYELFLDTLISVCGCHLIEIAIRAWITNEERTYYNCRPGNDTLIALVQSLENEKMDMVRFTHLMNIFLRAGNRYPARDTHGRRQSDIRLSLDGFFSVLLSPDGTWQHCLSLFTSGSPRSEFAVEPLSSNWELHLDTSAHTCTIESEPSLRQILGPRLPLTRLLSGTEPHFYRDGVRVTLTPIRRTDRLMSTW